MLLLKELQQEDREGRKRPGGTLPSGHARRYSSCHGHSFTETVTACERARWVACLLGRSRPRAVNLEPITSETRIIAELQTPGSGLGPGPGTSRTQGIAAEADPVGSMMRKESLSGGCG